MYKILIVEDDSIIAGTLKNHLCQWGFEVRCIEDFKNVLEETADFTPHLILLDIILPFLTDSTGASGSGNFPRCRLFFCPQRRTI